jgi:hypothetical protein
LKSRCANVYSLMVALLLLSGSASAKLEEGAPAVGGYVLASDAKAEVVAGHLNFALVKLGNATFSGANGGRTWRELELRFDAGNLRKRDLSRAKKHLDQMFRRMDQGDFEEASEQIFRSRRFIQRTFPFSMDADLFSEILYYQTLVNEKLGKIKQAREDYCTYLYMMSNLSRSTASIGQKVQQLKSCDPTDETGELVLSIRSKGGVVYIDGAPVGVVSSSIPYTAPFLGIGLHFVEVRRPGMARWGQVVEIKPGKTLKQKVRLKRARKGVNEVELEPLKSLILHGVDASGEAYVQDILFQYVQRVGLVTLLLGKVKSTGDGGSILRLVRFEAGKLHRSTVNIAPEAFEYETLMAEALRGVGIESVLSSSLAPKSVADYLYFKVK